MERNEKQRYETPLTGVFEVGREGVICASDAQRQDYLYEEW